MCIYLVIIKEINSRLKCDNLYRIVYILKTKIVVDVRLKGNIFRLLDIHCFSSRTYSKMNAQRQDDDDDERNGCSTSRKLGLTAAVVTVGLGVGAALYYFFNKRQPEVDQHLHQ